MDKFGTEQVVYMLAIFETVAIAYVYGLKNLCNDFEVRIYVENYVSNILALSTFLLR